MKSGAAQKQPASGTKGLRLFRSMASCDEESRKRAREYQLHQKNLYDWLVETLPIGDQLAQGLTAHIARKKASSLSSVCDKLNIHPEFLAEELKTYIKKLSERESSIKGPYQLLLTLISPDLADHYPKPSDHLRYADAEILLTLCCNNKIEMKYPERINLNCGLTSA